MDSVIVGFFFYNLHDCNKSNYIYRLYNLASYCHLQLQMHQGLSLQQLKRFYGNLYSHNSITVTDACVTKI